MKPRTSQAPLPRSTIPGIYFPALPAPDAATVLALVRRLRDSERWPAATLREWQSRQLRVVVEHARRTVPWYRQRYTPPPGGDAEAFFAWFAEQPLLPRAALEQAPGPTWSEAVPPDHGPVRPHHTSGTGGRVATVLGSTPVALMWHAMTLRDHRWHGRELGAGLLAIRSGRDATDPERVVDRDDWGGPVALCYEGGPSTLAYHRKPLPALVELLETRRPAHLLAYPAVAAAMARLCARRGQRPPALREVAAYGEPVEATHRDACRSAWDVPLHDRYSAEEVGYIALECPERSVLHAQSESVFLEVLEESGRPAPPGRAGRVVLSALHNLASPLLRYDIGDWAVAGAPCACGRGLPVLERVLGRARNRLALPGGRGAWPQDLDPRAWREELGIDEEQFVQAADGAVELRVVREAPLYSEQRARLRELVDEALSVAVPLTITQHATIARSANGKLERVVSSFWGKRGQ